MKKILILLPSVQVWILGHSSFSQQIYNEKNVDRTATSFFDGQQTFRALEYTVDPDPQSEKSYRLQTLT